MQHNGAHNQSIETERILPTVMIVDDEEINIHIIRVFLEDRDYEVVSARSGEEAIRKLQNAQVDVMICDIKMDGMSGRDVLKHMVANHPMVPVIMLTGYVDLETAIDVMRDGARNYLTKPLNRQELLDAVAQTLQWRQTMLSRTRHEQDTRNYQRELERRVEDAGLKVQKAMLDVVMSLSAALEARNRFVADHSKRVARLASLLGRELGLDSDKIRLVQQAAAMHDIGKLGMPDDLLTRTELFSPAQEEQYYRHGALGAEILQPITYMKTIIPAVKHHHERWDGRGLPDALAGKDIPLPARIISVCDAFDNMVTERSYRVALTSEQAVEQILRSKGSRFDPDIVDKFTVLISRITGIYK